MFILINSVNLWCIGVYNCEEGDSNTGCSAIIGKNTTANQNRLVTKVIVMLAPKRY